MYEFYALSEDLTQCFDLTCFTELFWPSLLICSTVDFCWSAVFFDWNYQELLFWSLISICNQDASPLRSLFTRETPMQSYRILLIFLCPRSLTCSPTGSRSSARDSRCDLSLDHFFSFSRVFKGAVWDESCEFWNFKEFDYFWWLAESLAGSCWAWLYRQPLFSLSLRAAEARVHFKLVVTLIGSEIRAEIG